jgi:hypothetical protein
MHAYGFSTGAIALGDFRKALTLLDGHEVTAVELSALRDHELPKLVDSLAVLDLRKYDYVSVHAPSQFSAIEESACADLLSACIPLGIPIVVHPDAVRDVHCWKQFGGLLCIENMDKRKADGRTVEELERWFERFPEAGFCLDLGHARQVDPSVALVFDLVERFGSRLTQIHLSEISTESKHHALSMATVLALRETRHLFGNAPVILESRVHPSEIEMELKMARLAIEAFFEATESGLVAV